MSRTTFALWALKCVDVADKQRLAFSMLLTKSSWCLLRFVPANYMQRIKTDRCRNRSLFIQKFLKILIFSTRRYNRLTKLKRVPIYVFYLIIRPLWRVSNSDSGLPNPRRMRYDRGRWWHRNRCLVYLPRGSWHNIGAHTLGAAQNFGDPSPVYTMCL